MSLPVVAIVGRPNVGKSTLFNRIVGFQSSVVHDRPGVTRDRLYETAEVLGRHFMMIDTGGIEPDPETGLFEGMRQQVLVAVEEANVILFVVDGRAGLNAADLEVASLLRKSGKPIIVSVNKIDGPKHDDFIADFWSLGLNHVFGISAEHSRGVYEMLETMLTLLPEPDPADEEENTEEDAFFGDETEAIASGEKEDKSKEYVRPQTISIAVIGRPNIGKSTLVNRLLGEERQVVDNIPGTTMDPVDSQLIVDDKEYKLVDTAGVRKKSSVSDQLERFVTLRAIQAIERCHVCLLMIDATEGITDQDAKLARLVCDRGRALVLLFNKWDLVKDIEEISAKGMEEQILQKLPHARWAPHLFTAAKTGKGLHRILPTIERIFENFNRHNGTSEVNRFLERIVSSHTPPQRFHRPVRLYYATQSRVRPPTFVFFSNSPEGIVDSYRAYLSNQLRESYDFEGTPLRLHFRKRRSLGGDKD